MAQTPSNMMPLGTKAPDFLLPDVVSGKAVGLSELKSEQATVVFFWCNHCPFVKHISAAVVSVAKQYQALGVSFVAISANDAEKYPQDAPEKMKETARKAGYTFPYLYDEAQQVARAYEAACTPDFYIFDAALQCRYRGRFDDSRPGNHRPVTGDDLKNALDALCAGKKVSADQHPSVGCNIKWKTEI